MKSTLSSIHPTVLIVLGATGDLMRKKIIPALFQLYLSKSLPKLFQIIGFSRRNLISESFREYVKTIIDDTYTAPQDRKKIDAFLGLIQYRQGQLEDVEAYKALAQRLGGVDGTWKACSNKLFYLAVPPEKYEVILSHLKTSGLTIPCSDNTGWTRILIEKPFGKNLTSSEELDLQLSYLFKEEQIYRIDHYLGKDMLQNILQFRFANDLFEHSWNKDAIQKVEIRLYEKLGVEHRGSFYDGLGAFRDVGQNHILQMLALVAMERPSSLAASDVRQKRAELLETLHVMSLEAIKNGTYRAQYKGYNAIEGTRSNSRTETYFKIHSRLNSQRWRGVPFILESGKRMGEARKEIIVHLHRNNVIFRLEPKEEIVVTLNSKKPGLNNEIEEKKIVFSYRKKVTAAQYVESYEKLLHDAIIGDQTLFASSREIRAMWHFTDPIIEAWRMNIVPLRRYTPDSSDFTAATKYIDDKRFLNRVALEASGLSIIGLGKMGKGMALRLSEKNIPVRAYNRTAVVTKELEATGILGYYSLASLFKHTPRPRVIWLMLTAGEVVDDMIHKIMRYLSKGDLVIDGANSYFKDTLRRHTLLKKQGVRFMDVGVSGGPSGARNGACLMVGGDKEDYEAASVLLHALSAPGAVGYFGPVGSGHFAKMIHNGIEYGMMESIAEGVALLKYSNFNIDLTEVLRVYNNQSVIASRLMGWAKEALEEDSSLRIISSTIQASGEGEWSVKTAHEHGIAIPAIEASLAVRTASAHDAESSPEGFRNKVVSALRGKFGHHPVSKDTQK